MRQEHPDGTPLPLARRSRNPLPPDARTRRTPIGEKIRRSCSTLNPGDERPRRGAPLLREPGAAYRRIIVPAIKKGTWVLTDRFSTRLSPTGLRARVRPRTAQGDPGMGHQGRVAGYDHPARLRDRNGPGENRRPKREEGPDRERKPRFSPQSPERLPHPRRNGAGKISRAGCREALGEVIEEFYRRFWLVEVEHRGEAPSS